MKQQEKFINKIYNMDCLEGMKQLPDASINLVIADPPYNIGVKTKKNGKNQVNQWDKIPDYIPWCISWLKECQRILKPNGVLYLWHNDIPQIAKLLESIKKETNFEYRSFCIWNKGGTYRARTWKNREPYGKTPLRSWFNICEYCLHFFANPKIQERNWRKTGLERINSNPECYKEIKEWYKSEMARLRLTEEDIKRKYTEATGKKPHMLRHYFKNSQFELPTREVFETVYVPMGFRYKERGYEEMRQDYEEMRQDYEEMRQDYEEMRNYHRCDPEHCNVWNVPCIPSNNRLHTCQKPLEILERLIRVSCPEEGIVLDPFMGSGSTAIAALNTERKFVGFEKDEGYFKTAQTRIDECLFAYTE